jgi:hypothetical protein
MSDKRPAGRRSAISVWRETLSKEGEAVFAEYLSAWELMHDVSIPTLLEAVREEFDGFPPIAHEAFNKWLKSNGYAHR